MAGDFLLVAAVFLAVGLPAAAFPSRVSKLGERVDAIGSKTSKDEVEPAEWNVTLTRFVGVFTSALGVAYLFA
ncbi:hypothetical protein C457_00365 [Haloferax prahovense DSM 18310]|uniref:DUF6199 domain-containing protein n=1 Tax=Haloferax prahovense (strain DSM 18310 / JCM 13924 / TL6) TaxID=1227461 RepID=M0GS13_HALPT|nr:hypothetical protein [Haloferax prahovense]ELZ73694.1 hypothetical protein C457_00365 [Haloferax prahovense DSM 18310]